MRFPVGIAPNARERASFSASSCERSTKKKKKKKKERVRSAPPAQHPVAAAAARKREKERALGSVLPGVNTPRGMDSVVKDAILEPPATRTVTRRVTYLVANKDARCILYLDTYRRISALAVLQIYRDPSYVLRIHGKVSPVLFFFPLALPPLCYLRARQQFTAYKSRARTRAHRFYVSPKLLRY